MSGDEELVRRIHAALDADGTLDGDPELAEQLSASPEAAEVARELLRVDATLREWPAPTRGEDAWEALAMRIEQRLDEPLGPMHDPTEAPALQDEASVPPAAQVPASVEVSEEYSLSNLAALDMDEEEVVDIERITSVPPAPPPETGYLTPRTGERFSLPDLKPLPLGEVPTLEIPIQPRQPPPRRNRGALIAGGVAAAAAVGLAVVGGFATLGQSEPEVMAVADHQAEADLGWAEEAETNEVSASAPVPETVVGGAGPGAPTRTDSTRAAGVEGSPQSAAAATPVSEEPSEPAPAPEPLSEPSPGVLRPAPPPAPARLAPEAEPRASEMSASVRRRRAPRPPAERASRNPARSNVPDRSQVQEALRAITPAVRACGGGARDGVVQVDITVANTGRVSSVLVIGEFAGTAEGSCVARAVRRARFPSFRRRTFQIRYPFRL